MKTNKISVFILTMKSSPTQLCFYGNDVILVKKVTSSPTQFSFHDNDVIP